MTKVYFNNPGEIDPRAITTLGVNVKDGESPIGRFGTGLKYAIAGILRLGGQIIIASGDESYKFHSEPETIRGKVFRIVYMGGKALGFTTNLGKDWKPWMIYRELRSNALDEGGEASLSPTGEGTVVEVDCEEIFQSHQTRAEFWLEGEPLWQGDGVAVFDGESRSLFYHGIMASGSGTGTQWQYSYSITEDTTLTEDRTFANLWEIRQRLGKALAQCTDGEIVAKALARAPENQLDFDWSVDPSEEFVVEVLDRIRKKKDVPESARAMVKKFRPKAVDEAEVEEVPESYEDMLDNEPEVKEVTESRYKYDRQMNERMESLEARAKFWKTCAQKLSQKQGLDAVDAQILEDTE